MTFEMPPMGPQFQNTEPPKEEPPVEIQHDRTDDEES